MIGWEIWPILLGWAIAGGSPGPATLAITGTSMETGRKAGLTVASGIISGSASWGIAAALGMSALMMANAWVFEIIRYVGAAYLLFLACKSLRSAFANQKILRPRATGGKLFSKGLLLHLTNPKATLSWGAIYSIALPQGAAPAQVWQLFVLLIVTSMIVFWGYAWLFSSAKIARAYTRMRRGFELVFALLFGAASLKILTAKLEV